MRRPVDEHELLGLRAARLAIVQRERAEHTVFGAEDRSGPASAQAVFDATEAADQAAVSGNVFDILTGELVVVEEADSAAVSGMTGLWLVLNASEEEDTANFKTWALPFGRCQPKTICLVGERAKEPEMLGSMADRDTETCRPGWDKKAA